MHKISNFCRIDEREYALSTGNMNVLYYDLPKHFHDEYRSYDAPRLCTILKGSKSVVVNQSGNFQYQSDQSILLPPNSTIYMTMPEETKALVYEFHEPIIEQVRQRVSDTLELNAPTSINSHQFAINPVDQRIEVLHSRMQEIIRSQDTSIDFLIDLTGQEMVFELMRKTSCQSIITNHNKHPISKAIRIMRSSSGLQMSLSHIAEEVGMSLSSFSQKFKAVTQVSPNQYLTQLRLQAAYRNLASMSVTDAAFESGYNNISHFIRLFKNEYGMTPKQFQQIRVVIN
ncbi:AraC family transcriptional regulator [Vibrio sp. ZSDZ65]|uniref:AraC family transcriptional regulator n=1 Tax=Vibrio qingdaonensis TaxID=2829491 RepID=A0A9X3CSZ6_9VIBR|nr:AraC family transcriptional regulator [Vibrio qingdaonensis]MCW8348888.1 AraC family transcriptional regulator [Vibrio qingdaonensis]